MNMDNFEETKEIAGLSEPYDAQSKTSFKKFNLYDSLKYSNSEKLPFDKSRIVNDIPGTPNMRKFPRTDMTSSPSARSVERILGTPHNNQTPHQSSYRGTVTPTTPKSCERNTLLGWLSSSKKTPSSKFSCLPSTSSAVSATKRAGLKRKLTDVMESEQENAEMEDKKVCSPTKDILTDATNSENQSPRSSVAKTLYYDESQPKRFKEMNDKLPNEIGDSLQPLDENTVFDFKKGFLKPNCFSPETKLSNKHESERFIQYKFDDDKISNTFSIFSSPTSKLPNFVLDGSSPHNRPELPVGKKKETNNWLATFSHKKKLNSVEQSPSSSRSNSKPKPKHKLTKTPKKPKILKIKKLSSFLKNVKPGP